MRNSNLYSLFLIMTLILSSVTFAQEQNSGMVKKADGLYADFDFTEAIEAYERVLKKYPDYLYAKEQIGNCYRFLNDMGSAEEWYAPVAASNDANPLYKFYYGQSLIANGKYNEGLSSFNSYYAAIGNQSNILNSYPVDFSTDDRYDVSEVDFNTDFSEFSPFKVGNQLFFVSNRSKKGLISDVWTNSTFTQLYVMDLEKNSTPEVFRGDVISKKYHEGPVAYNPVTNDLYITKSNYTNNKVTKGVNDEINLVIEKIIFNNDIEGDDKSPMVNNLSFSSPDYSVAYPTITSDGNYLVFASDMPGGYGGLDLYVCQNLGGTWSNAINLGDKINTPGNECYPFILESGTLYFSSNGHPGFGGLDIYSSKLMSDGSFDYPTNVKAPLNSPEDDFGFYLDESSSNGYFSSNRMSVNNAGDNIYYFETSSYTLEAKVYDSEDNSNLDAVNVTLTNLDNGEVVSLISDAYGMITGSISPNTNYKLQVVKDGFLVEEAEFKTAEDDVYAEIPLVKDFGIILDVSVQDVDSKEMIPSSVVKLIDLGTGEESAKTTNADGKTQFMLEESRAYKLVASKESGTDEFLYLSISQEFNTYNTKTPANLTSALELKKQAKDDEIEIEDIYYDLGKFDILPSAALQLDKLVKTLNDNPNIHIELSSHTDCRGSAKYNTWLSAKRAESAVNYLIENGIAVNRLTAAGYGESKLKEDCACESCTDTQHQANRRTVFAITKN